MNLLLRLSHASTAFDDSGNLMHDTSLFFVFANYSIFQAYSRVKTTNQNYQVLRLQQTMRLNDSIRSPCTSAAIGKVDLKHSFWENGVAAVKMSPMFDDKLMSM
jgi:hypothetical protein